MVVYGINPILEALRLDPNRIERVTVQKGKGSRRLQEVIDLARANRIPVHFEPVQSLDRKAGSTSHQSVVAEISGAQLVELGQILDANPHLLVLVDGVEDPHNLGALIRTAEAAGVDGLLLPSRHSCGITPTVVKSSAGAALHLPICRIGNPVQTLRSLKESGFWVVGLDMEGNSALREVDPGLPLVIVVGGEHRGVRRLIRENCDFLVALPMRGKVGSLNLSVAAAILIYSLRLREEGKL